MLVLHIVSNVHRYKSVEVIPRVSPFHSQYLTAHKRDHTVISSFLPPEAAAWNTNWHPVLYPGVHAETWLVPAEHLSGPVPVAAAQKGPHTAQVHRRWHVRTLLDETCVYITKKDYNQMCYCFPKTPKHLSCWKRNENWQCSANHYGIGRVPEVSVATNQNQIKSSFFIYPLLFVLMYRTLPTDFQIRVKRLILLPVGVFLVIFSSV